MSAELRPQVVTLDNGLRLVLTELPHARSVSVSIYVNAGARYEAAQDLAVGSRVGLHDRRNRPFFTL